MKQYDTAEGLELVEKLAGFGGDVEVTNVQKASDGYTVTVNVTAPNGKLWSRNGRENETFTFDLDNAWLNDTFDYFGEDEDDDKDSIIYVIENVSW